MRETRDRDVAAPYNVGVVAEADSKALKFPLAYRHGTRLNAPNALESVRPGACFKEEA